MSHYQPKHASNSYYNNNYGSSYGYGYGYNGYNNYNNGYNGYGGGEPPRETSGFGRFMTVVISILMVAFDVILYFTQLLTLKYFVTVCVILLVIVILLHFLMRYYRPRGRFAAGVILSLIYAVLLILGGYYLLRTVSTLQDISTSESDTTIFQQLTATDYNDPFVMYISGIDSREGLVEDSRSDSNIIAVVNPSTKQVLLVSTPRDYYVELSVSNGEYDKLTHAGIYGVECSMDTLEMLYGVDIDYYFRVNFTGFEQIIDALGGITVYSDYTFDSTYSGVDTGTTYHYEEGYNDLDGTAALYFARERYAFADGDRQRGKNQLAVIEAVIDKITSPAILRDYTSLLDGLSGSFETSMPYDLMTSLVRNQLDDGTSWDVQSYSVDGESDTRYCYSLGAEASVVIPDESTVSYATELMNAVLAGEVVSVES